MTRRKQHNPAAIEKALVHSANASDALDDTHDAMLRATRELAYRMDQTAKAIDNADTMFADPAAAAQIMSKVAYSLQIFQGALRELKLTPQSGGTIHDDEPSAFDEARQAVGNILAGPWPADWHSNAEDRDPETG